MKQDICEWLREKLKSGSCEATELRNAARAAGYTRGELREARLICGVETSNNWSPLHPFTDQWYWSLPKEEK